MKPAILPRRRALFAPRTLFSLFVLFGLSLLFTLAPATSAWAQDASYTLTLPDKNRMRLRLRVEPQPEGRKVARIDSQAVPGAPADVRFDSILRANPDGTAEYLRLQFRINDLPLSDVEAQRLENGAYRVQLPAKQGVLRYGAPVFSLNDLLSLIGRRYDWKKGGVQKGVYLDPFSDDAALWNLTLEAGEKTTLKLGEPLAEVPVRTLKAVATLGSGKTQQKREGTLYIGPYSETLKAEGNLVLLPFSAKEPTKRTETGYETPFAVLPIKSKVERTRTGLIVRVVLNDRVELSTLETDPAGNPIRWLNKFRGRDFQVTFTGVGMGEARYKLDAGQVTIQEVSTGRPWFPPYGLATELWETGRGAFAEMAVGEKREGDHFILFTGQRDSLPFTLERREDVTTTVGGQTVTVRWYRFDGNVIYDYYTDGRRLLAALGSDGSRTVQDGWESFADRRKAPELPKSPRDGEPRE
jgi:hypothetical protein